MDNDRIARNLECVEKHFHSEAANEVEAARAIPSQHRSPANINGRR